MLSSRITSSSSSNSALVPTAQQEQAISLYTVYIENDHRYNAETNIPNLKKAAQLNHVDAQYRIAFIENKELYWAYRVLQHPPYPSEDSLYPPFYLSFTRNFQILDFAFGVFRHQRETEDNDFCENLARINSLSISLAALSAFEEVTLTIKNSYRWRDIRQVKKEINNFVEEGALELMSEIKSKPSYTSDSPQDLLREINALLRNISLSNRRHLYTLFQDHLAARIGRLLNLRCTFPQEVVLIVISYEPLISLSLIHI